MQFYALASEYRQKNFTNICISINAIHVHMYTELKRKLTYRLHVQVQVRKTQYTLTFSLIQSHFNNLQLNCLPNLEGSGILALAASKCQKEKQCYLVIASVPI